MNPLSGVLGEAWATYRTHARHFISIAFVLYLVAALLQALFVTLLGVIGTFVAAVVGIVAAFLLQAAPVKAVEDVRDGRADLSLTDTLQAARPAVPRVAAASILASIAIVFGFALLVLPGLVLLTIWCLIVPVIVLEGVGVGGSFRRSFALVKPYAMQVFLTLILVFLVLLVANLAIGLILAALPQAARSIIGGVISGTLISPFLAVVLTLGYYRLRGAQRGTSGAGATYG